MYLAKKIANWGHLTKVNTYKLVYKNKWIKNNIK